MDITAMDTATIFALKWCEDHRQQLCRQTGGTTSHLSFWTDRRQNRQNGKATCRSKKIICICIVDPALLSKTFQTVIQIKQNQETNHLPLSPPQNEWMTRTDISSKQISRRLQHNEPSRRYESKVQWDVIREPCGDGNASTIKLKMEPLCGRASPVSEYQPEGNEMGVFKRCSMYFFSSQMWHLLHVVWRLPTSLLVGLVRLVWMRNVSP